MGVQERRARRKRRLTLELVVEVAGRRASTLDISSDGLGLEIEGRFSLPRSLYGSVQLGKHRCAFSGEVVWTQGGQQYRRVGVRFHRVDALLVNTLEEIARV